MTLTNNNIRLHDRKHAAHLLAGKLLQYKNSDAIVAGIGPGGASFGFSLAKELNLSFELILCRKIKHPGDHRRTIGSVSDGQALIHDNSYDIPQDFILHQISKLRCEIKSDYKFLFGDAPRPCLQHKTIILVCDLLDTPDQLMAALRSIKSQRPFKIVVASPFVASRVVSKITNEVDDLVFLQIESGSLEGKDFYEKFPRVDLAEAKRLLNESTRVN